MRRASLALAGFLAFNLPWVCLRRRRRGGGKRRRRWDFVTCVGQKTEN